MKKLILISFSLLLCLSSFTQSRFEGKNWLCVHPDRTVYFETGSHREVFTIRIDSISDDGKILYPFSVLHQIDWDCWSITDGSWISRYIILDDDGNTFFVNGNDERIFIKSQAALNETWQVFENNQIRVRGKISAIDERDVLGVKDSVKTISFSVYNLDDTPRSHDLNQATIEVSKHFGLVKTIQFYNWRSAEQFTLIGIKELQFGFQVPRLKEDFFDFQPGDELHTLERRGCSLGSGSHEIEIRTRYRYLSRTDYADRIEYTKEQKVHSRRRFWPNDTEISTTISTGTQTIQKDVVLFTTEPNEPFYHRGELTRVVIRNTAPLEMYFENLNLWRREETSCYETVQGGTCFVPNIYILGLGGSYRAFCTDMWSHCWSGYELVYYKKGDIEFGTQLEFPTNIEMVEIVDFAIFPNPANDRIFIKTDNSELLHNSIIEIYDISGRKQLSKPLDISEGIDVSFLQSGYYIVKIIRENKVLVRAKMIKK